ncbi:hypothetical protein Wcon_00646 [Wolbachia endosymbiont of Cylisticus convexus]|nr:hypothetical protein Wcon_00646 [Wolbachia endosymbiont of Cylisticus convexus]
MVFIKKMWKTTYQSLQSENEALILRTLEDCYQECRNRHSDSIRRNFCYFGCQVTHPQNWLDSFPSHSQKSTLSENSEDYTNHDSTNPLPLYSSQFFTA